jgi:hypothetical protein
MLLQQCLLAVSEYAAHARRLDDRILVMTFYRFMMLDDKPGIWSIIRSLGLTRIDIYSHL